jgi:hypothetical protein
MSKLPFLHAVVLVSIMSVVVINLSVLWGYHYIFPLFFILYFFVFMFFLYREELVKKLTLMNTRSRDQAGGELRKYVYILDDYLDEMAKTEWVDAVLSIIDLKPFKDRSTAEQQVDLTAYFHGQIGNGGFVQYFQNMDLNRVNDPGHIEVLATIEALKTIGFSKRAALLESSLARYLNILESKIYSTANEEYSDAFLEKTTSDYDAFSPDSLVDIDFIDKIYSFVQDNKDEFSVIGDNVIIQEIQSRFPSP